MDERRYQIKNLALLTRVTNHTNYIQQREPAAKEEDYDDQEASQAEYFASENESENSCGGKKTQEVIIRSVINSNIFRVIKFITEDNLEYGSKFSQCCMFYQEQSVTDKAYWSRHRKMIGQALNTKISTSSVAVKNAFMSK
jgi:hypothetical protein